MDKPTEAKLNELIARKRRELDLQGRQPTEAKPPVFLCRTCKKPIPLPPDAALKLIAQGLDPGKAPLRCNDCLEAEERARQEQEQQRRRRTQAEAVERIRADPPAALGRCGVPMAHRQAAFAACPDLPKALVEQAREWANSPHGFLYFRGPTGTGKTWLAVAALRYALTEGVLPEGACLFIGEMAYLDALRRAMGEQGGAPRRLERLERARLLVLDDLASAYLTPWGKGQMARLVELRYEARAPTLITSNVPLDDLAAAIDDRVASRITQVGATMRFPERDLRLCGSIAPEGMRSGRAPAEEGPTDMHRP